MDHTLKCSQDQTDQDGLPGAMTRTLQVSQSKLIVKSEMQHWGKNEVKVTLANGYKSFVPSFTDLYRIVSEIGKKENERYPDGQGSGMLGRFLTDAANGLPFERLIYKYNIPLTFADGTRHYPEDILGKEECKRRANGAAQWNLFE